MSVADPNKHETLTSAGLVLGQRPRRWTLFYYHIKYQLLNMLKIKRDINQQDVKIVYFHFVKSE